MPTPKRVQQLFIDTSMDTRREVQRLLGTLEVQSWRQVLLFVLCVSAGAAVAYLPRHEGLNGPSRHALFILVTSALLWITEAIPAFAVALLLIGLEIWLLGGFGREVAGAAFEYSEFLAPWASPLVWLFFGSFVLGKGATRTGLDKLLAHHLIRVMGGGPKKTLLGLMAMAFVFSMFTSNTSATAMLLAASHPIVSNLDQFPNWRKRMVIAVPVAANLGGMGTIIGSPPNAIAAAALVGSQSVDFAKWMLLGLPPALLLLVIAMVWMVWGNKEAPARLELPDDEEPPSVPRWTHLVVIATFVATVSLWLSSSLHGIPTPVVSFLPVCVFAMTGILSASDLRSLQWDVLILITGGLALGVAVSGTGLATWLVSLIPEGSAILMAVALVYGTSIISNFMSNTAATNIAVPVVVVLFAGQEAATVVPIALAASTAMCLPISTPPNALAFAGGHLKTTDFLPMGLLMFLLAPAAALLWVRYMV